MSQKENRSEAHQMFRAVLQIICRSLNANSTRAECQSESARIMWRGMKIIYPLLIIVWTVLIGSSITSAGTESGTRKEPPSSIATRYLEKGEEYFHQGRFAEAIAEYKRAVESDPGFAKAHIFLGDAYFQAGNFREAIVHYDEAIKLDPGRAEAYSWKGDALAAQSSFTEAIKSYKQALQIRPAYKIASKSLSILINKTTFNDAGQGSWEKAQTYLKEMKYTSALEELEKVRQLSPNCPLVAQALGDAWSRTKNFDVALEHYKRAVELNTSDPETQLALGSAHLDACNTAMALEHVTLALVYDPKQKEATKQQKFLKDLLSDENAKERSENFCRLKQDILKEPNKDWQRIFQLHRAHIQSWMIMRLKQLSLNALKEGLPDISDRYAEAVAAFKVLQQEE